MQIALDGVTPENTFDHTIHFVEERAPWYRPGGTHYNVGFAREFVIGHKLGVIVHERSLRLDGGVISFVTTDTLTAQGLRDLLDGRIEFEGKTYVLSDVRPDSARTRDGRVSASEISFRPLQ